MLAAKILLRRTWENGCEKLKWDNPLPSDLVRDMISFFINLFELESLEFPRSLLPKKLKTIGKPDLVVFSDQSVVAYGSVSYIRWKLESGKMVDDVDSFKKQNSA